MDFSFIKSPWVIGGGVLVGAYLIFFSGGSSSGNASGGTYQSANLDLVALQGQLSADVEKTRLSAEATNTATIAATFANILGAKYANDLGMAQVSAGVQSVAIASRTAERIDHEQQITQRRGISAALNADVINTNAAITGQTIQANTAKDIAHTQAAVQNRSQTLGFFGDVLSAIKGL